MTKPIILSDAEMKKVERGTYYYEVVDASALVLCHATRLTTTLEMIEKYKGFEEELTKEEEKELKKLCAKVKKSIEDWERIDEMYKKHPLSP